MSASSKFLLGDKVKATEECIKMRLAGNGDHSGTVVGFDPEDKLIKVQMLNYGSGTMFHPDLWEKVSSGVTCQECGMPCLTCNRIVKRRKPRKKVDAARRGTL